MYTKDQFGKMIDHTLLRPEATKSDVLRLVDEAVARHFASVCIFPCWVGTASRALQGTDVKVCSVISFPFGADTRASKSYAIKNAINNGAKEIDAVINVSRLKSGDFDAVARDVTEMVDAVHGNGSSPISDGSRRVLLKVIIETCYLNDTEKETVSKLVRDSGADFIKTSTGTGPSGATVDDIRLIRRAVGPSMLGIKASGGIKTVEQAINLMDAGASRIGTSSGAALYDAYRPEDWQ